MTLSERFPLLEVPNSLLTVDQVSHVFQGWKSYNKRRLLLHCSISGGLDAQAWGGVKIPLLVTAPTSSVCRGQVLLLSVCKDYICIRVTVVFVTAR